MTLHDVHILDKINQNKLHTIHEKVFIAKNKYKIKLPTETLIDYFYNNKMTTFTITNNTTIAI